MQHSQDMYRGLRLPLVLLADPKTPTQIGATRGSQLEETLRAIEDGPLDENIAKRVDKIWELVKDEAPVDNYYP